ncbi:MAG TPA: thiamine phosphate synthase [Acidimicrobiales bacterium]|nr:thiamine phosphate synthase [Acidimicrobiales bacterium]
MTAGRPPTAPAIGRLHVLVDTLGLAEAALEAGAPTVQVRLKSGADVDRLRLTGTILERCRDAGATCLVDDRVDLALAVGADGVHLGEEDLPVPVARRLLGTGAIIGGTARDPGSGRRLVAEGATYLGVGPCFPTRSKRGLPEPIGVAGVRAVAAAVDVPVIAISGITPGVVAEVLAAGAYGVAVIGAVAEAVDPHVATHQLLVAVAEAVGAGVAGEAR